MGQFMEITAQLFPDKTTDSVVQGLLDRLHVEILSMPPNSYIGINGVPEEFKVAYDLKQVIRYHLSFHKNPSGDIGVNFDSPRNLGEEFPAKIETGLSDGAEQLLKIIRERVRWKKEKTFDPNEFVTPKGSKYVKELSQYGHIKKTDGGFTLTTPT
jgi:hypothetical protein